MLSVNKDTGFVISIVQRIRRPLNWGRVAGSNFTKYLDIDSWWLLSRRFHSCTNELPNHQLVDKNLGREVDSKRHLPTPECKHCLHALSRDLFVNTIKGKKIEKSLLPVKQHLFVRRKRATHGPLTFEISPFSQRVIGRIWQDLTAITQSSCLIRSMNAYHTFQ